MKWIDFYLHIGIPKTGSSALQKFFYENREQLKKHGIYYPLTGLEGWAHHYLPASINGRNFKTDIKYFDLLGKIIDENNYKQGDKVLLSSEAFHNIRAGEEMELLKKGLCEHRVKIIAYLRRQDHWVTSSYKQEVKSYRARLTDNISKYVKSRKVHNIINYPAFFKKWEDAFGLENIIIKVYEKEQMHEGLYQNFLDIFNIKLDANFNLTRETINPSFSSVAVNIMRTFNRYPMSVKTHLKIVKMFEKIPMFIKNNNMPDNYLLPSDERQALINHYRDSNAEIAKRYLNRDDGILFYEK